MTDHDDAERMLGPMDKMILEALETEHDFVDGAQLIGSLNLKNQFLANIAIDAMSELVQFGLVAASGGTQVRITPLGRKTLEREGRLSREEKDKMTG